MSQTTDQPKFKKGQQVCYKGELTEVKGTYIHHLIVNHRFYIIQHPHGSTLEVIKINHFTVGEDLSKLNPSLKYAIVREDELTAFQPEVPAQVMQSVSFSKEVWDVVIGACIAQYVGFKKNKFLMKMQAGLSEQDYQEILKNTEMALRSFKDQGLIDSLAEFEIE